MQMQRHSGPGTLVAKEQLAMTTESATIEQLKAALESAKVELANAKDAEAKFGSDQDLADPMAMRAWLMEHFDEASALRGAVKRAENAVANANTAIEKFHVNERFERMLPARRALIERMREVVAYGLPTPPVVRILANVKLEATAWKVEPRIFFGDVDTSGLADILATELSNHTKDASELGFTELIVDVTELNTASPVYDVRRPITDTGHRPSTSAAPTTPRVNGDSPFVAGQTLAGKYKGTAYEARVTDAGFEYNGTVYASASAAAKAITGTSVNGNKFWSVKS